MNIRETVYETMEKAGLSGYQDRAAPVIAALEAREADMAADLIAFATDQGLSRDQARSALANVGLGVVTAADGRDETIRAMEEQVASLQAQIRDLR